MHVFAEQKKKTLQIFLYVWMQKIIQSSENEYHDEILKINTCITTKAGKLQSTNQFDTRSGQNLNMQFWVKFQSLHFAQGINQCENFIS